jgi:hypothetical protein
VSAAPSRRARCRRCCPAAVRSPTPRHASTSRRCGASSRSRACRAATRPGSSKPPAPTSWDSWSVGSTPTTCPTRRPRSPRCTRRRSWSASRSARVRRRRSPTWCCRSRRWSRRPAPSSTGRAASVRSTPCCATPVRCPTSGRSTRSLPRWASGWDSPTSTPSAASSTSSAVGRVGAPRRHRCAPRSRRARVRVRRCSPRGATCSTRAACRTASRSSRARPSALWPGCPRRPLPRSAWPPASW